MKEYAKCQHCGAILKVDQEDFMAYKGNFLVAMDEAKLCCKNPCINWLYGDVVYVGVRHIETELYKKDKEE